MKSSKVLNILIPVVFFLIFILLISYKLLGKYVAYGDYPYLFPSTSGRLVYTWNENLLGYTTLQTMFGVPLTFKLPTLLTSMSIPDSYASYILNYLPVFLVCLATYFIVLKISGKYLISFALGIFVILNNFMFEQFVFWPGHYFWNLLALLLLYYYLFISYKQGFVGNKMGILIALSSILCLHPFFFVLYILSIVIFMSLGSYLKFVSIRRKIILVVFSGIFLIHLYWLLPFVATTVYIKPDEVYSGNLSSMLAGYISVASVRNLINYSNYPGSILGSYGASAFSSLFYFSLILTLIYLFFKSVNLKDNKFIKFLFFSYIVFFFLSLGPNIPILGGFWMWLFNHVPMAGFFRSFTRFFTVSHIVLIFIFAVCYRSANKSNYKNTALLIIFIVLGLYANRLFFTGDMGGYISSVVIPKEYEYLNDKYLSDSGLYNVISFPNTPYEAYDWSINPNTASFSQIFYLNPYFFKKPVLHNGFAIYLNNKNDLFKKLLAFYKSFKFYDNLDSDLRSLNIRYVLIRKDLVDIKNENLKVDYSTYLYYFGNNSNYTLKEANKIYSLYELSSYEPRLILSSGTYRYISPVEYSLEVPSSTSSVSIRLNQAYSSGWNIYRKFSSSSCSEKIFCNIVVALKNSLIINKPIPNSEHSRSYNYMNEWKIPINDNSNKLYEEKTKDFSLHYSLYYAPQILFLFGLYVSALTFFSLLIIFIKYSILEKKFKKRG